MDIDLLICPGEENLYTDVNINKYHIRWRKSLGMQKIDIVVRRAMENRSVVQTALDTGVEL